MTLAHKADAVILTRREHYAADYALVLRQRHHDEQITLQIRRVQPPGYPEELQIEISLEKFGEKRTTGKHGSFICSPTIADRIAEACTVLRVPNKA